MLWKFHLMLKKNLNIFWLKIIRFLSFLFLYAEAKKNLIKYLTSSAVIITSFLSYFEQISFFYMKSFKMDSFSSKRNVTIFPIWFFWSYGTYTDTQVHNYMKLTLWHIYSKYKMKKTWLFELVLNTSVKPLDDWLFDIPVVTMT